MLSKTGGRTNGLGITRIIVSALIPVEFKKVKTKVHASYIKSVQMDFYGLDRKGTRIGFSFLLFINSLVKDLAFKVDRYCCIVGCATLLG